jgi:hypothetical protein
MRSSPIVGRAGLGRVHAPTYHLDAGPTWITRRHSGAVPVGGVARQAAADHSDAGR